MSELVKLTIWFDEGPAGPKSYSETWTSRATAERCYETDPFFLGIQGEGEEPPQRVRDYQRGRDDRPGES